MKTKEKLQAELTKLQSQIERIEAKDPLRHDAISDHFHLGMVGGSGNASHVRKLNERRERSVDVAVELAPLYRQQEHLLNLIALYDQRLAHKQRLQQEQAERQERLRNVQPGQQVILMLGNTVTVKRVNKKSITSESGSKWNFDELVDVVSKEG